MESKASFETKEPSASRSAYPSPPAAAAPPAAPPPLSGDADERFVCNVCLDQVTDPVVTLCGHLYW
jgi:hypothetical protein